MTNDQYSTPKWLLDIFRDWYDPCPLNSNPERDGLKLDWGRRTFVNPPYSNVEPWVDKAIAEKEKGKLVVLLLRVDTTTRWFGKLVAAGAHILWHLGRISFRKDGARASFGSMMVILG